MPGADWEGGKIVWPSDKKIRKVKPELSSGEANSIPEVEPRVEEPKLVPRGGLLTRLDRWWKSRGKKEQLLPFTKKKLPDPVPFSRAFDVSSSFREITYTVPVVMKSIDVTIKDADGKVTGTYTLTDFVNISGNGKIIITVK